MSTLGSVSDAALPRQRWNGQGSGGIRTAAPSGRMAASSVGRTAERAGSTAPIPCGTEDPELWFSESPADLDVAKALCAVCPRRARCLAGALERREPWGVWGGQILQNGAVIDQKRGRGRPRKNQDAA